MVLRGTFKLGGDFIEVIIKGNEVLFYDLATHTLTPVSGLKLSKAGTIKEFPQRFDLGMKKFYYYRLKIVESSSNEPFQFDGYTIEYNLEEEKR